MDMSAYFQFIIALLFVLALIFLLAYGAKRFGLMARVTVKNAKTANKRLDIIEILPVDARRKLMLIRRDGVEHLIMLGLDGDIVVERNIPAKTEKIDTL